MAENIYQALSENDPDIGEIEKGLRPKSWHEYIGQEVIKQNLHIAIQAAQARQESVDHVLFSGPPGLGKTTLAHLVASEMRGTLHITSGPAVERSGDLAALLTALEEGDVLFIDEIHRLPKVVEEVLYPAMEDFRLDLVMGKGAGARSVKIDLPSFTLIGATTRSGALSSPLRDRFGIVHNLQFYSQEEIAQIVQNSAKKLSCELPEQAANTIAQRARKTPRIANRLLKRVRDYAQVKQALIDVDLAANALDQLLVDEHGLEYIDREILNFIVQNYQGGPVGISTIAAAIGQEKETIEDVYEPYLIQSGFIQKTSKGRMTTAKAARHLGLEPIVI